MPRTPPKRRLTMRRSRAGRPMTRPQVRPSQLLSLPRPRPLRLRHVQRPVFSFKPPASKWQLAIQPVLRSFCTSFACIILWPRLWMRWLRAGNIELGCSPEMPSFIFTGICSMRKQHRQHALCKPLPARSLGIPLLIMQSFKCGPCWASLGVCLEGSRHCTASALSHEGGCSLLS